MSIEINPRKIAKEIKKDGPDWDSINVQFPSTDLSEIRKKERSSIEKYVPDNTQSEIDRVKKSKLDDWNTMNKKLKEREQEKENPLQPKTPIKLEYL